MHMREHQLGFFDQITKALDTVTKGAQQVLTPIQQGRELFTQYRDAFTGGGGTSPFNIPPVPSLAPIPQLPMTSTAAPQSSFQTIQPTTLSQSEIMTVQTRLKEIGFNPGPLDGLYGPRTESAIKAFQSAQGLPPTGRADLELLNRLKPIATSKPSNPVNTSTPQNPVNQGSGTLPYRPNPVQQVPVPVPVAAPQQGMPQWLIPAAAAGVALIALTGRR